MPGFETLPRGFTAVTLAFVGVGVVLAVPFVRLFRRLVPKAPETA